jgi:DNA polymerase-3 subunit epsilon
LHGALLDAELLADVYINLTRGQEALLIDSGTEEGQAGSEESIDLSAFVLPVLKANAQELAAHDEQMVQLDKASGGKTLWRQAAAA